jgi:hypothetical protein
MSWKLLFFLAPLACSSAATPTDAGAEAATDGGDPNAAETAFWNAFWAGDMTAGASDVAALQAKASANPQDWYANLLTGMDATWLLAEAGRDPQTAQQAGETYGPIAGQFLGTAHAINPQDAFTTALDGFLVWNAGMQMQNTQQAAQGKGLVDQAYAQQPELGWFLELIIAQFSPLNDPQMQTAIDAGWKYLSICSGTTVDPKNPDLTAYLAQAKTSTKAFCANDSIAPHMVEGSLLYFGDLLVKSNAVPAAKTMFAAAQTTKDYANWPHKDVVDARVTADLDARAALYQGAPSQWPSFAASPYVCGTCHNTK